jgi:hypothetical protein
LRPSNAVVCSAFIIYRTIVNDSRLFSEYRETWHKTVGGCLPVLHMHPQ